MSRASTASSPAVLCAIKKLSSVHSLIKEVVTTPPLIHQHDEKKVLEYGSQAHGVDIL